MNSSKHIVVSTGLAIVLGCIFLDSSVLAQTPLKKIRMGIASANISYLAFFAAQQIGFFKDEGIDLELIRMSPTMANTAVLTGDLDYNGTPTGVIGGAIRGQPTKVLIFTVARPQQFLMSRKEITEPRQLKGRKVASSSGAGSTTFIAYRILRGYGLEPGKDVEVVLLGGDARSRWNVLETGAVDAAFLASPENVFAAQKGFNELSFPPEWADFPQNGFGTSEKRIREHPDEVYRMVRALMRGLDFLWQKENHKQILDVVLKQYRLNDRKMATELYQGVMRVMTRDAAVSLKSVQILVDFARQAANISRPVMASEVYDSTFVDKARRELGMTK